jgi:arginase
MTNTLFNLNAEWQGCENNILEKGATKLASDLFVGKPYSTLKAIESNDFNKLDGVFALNAIGDRFTETLDSFENATPTRIMTVGGSCGTEAAPVAYLNNIYQGRIAVVWFDAHGDLNTPESSPSGHFHGMVLRTLLGEGPDVFCERILRPLLSEQIFLAGARDLDEVEQDYIDQSNITVSQVNLNLIDLILDAGFSKVYIHIDVDVLNPQDFSDMLMPTEGGPSCSELTQCLSAMSEKLDVIGVGVVEYCGNHQNSSKQLSGMLQDSGLI